MKILNMKTVLITGSSRGIGKATAMLFAKKGWYVFLNTSKSFDDLAATACEIERKYGNVYTILNGDVSNSSDVKNIFNKIYNKTDHLDLLINNAGTCHIGLFHHMSDYDWNKIINNNLNSIFYCSKAAVKKMLEKKEGKIINISSIWGETGASCEVAYSTTKAAINGLTKALAKELAPSNIQVNAISFGMVDTLMNNHLSSSDIDKIIEDIPANKIASPQEAAQFIWDVSNLEKYMTGQIIRFDGGLI